MRAKNADCTCTHSAKIKFNVRHCGAYESELDFTPKHFNLVPSFPGYEIAQRLIFLWCFYSVLRFSFFCFLFFCFCLFVCLFFFLAFFTIAMVKQPHYKRISLHSHPVLHPITLYYILSAVVLLALWPTLSVYSPFLLIDYRSIWLDFSQRRYFGLFRHAFALYIDLDTLTLLPGWIILMNLGARRQKSQVLRPCFDLVNCSLYSVCALLVSKKKNVPGLKHGKLDIRWE